MAITKVSPGLLDLDSGITITTADNTDTLTLISTDADAAVGPVLNLYRNSSSPADNDLVGQIKVVARNDNSQDVEVFRIDNYIVDVSDGTEDSTGGMYQMRGGTMRETLTFGSTEFVINDASTDLDFRVESNSNSSMLFVDAGNDRVGIGDSPRGGQLDVKSQLNMTNSGNVSLTGLKATTFGYSSSYKVLQLGDSASSTAANVAIGVDLSGNASGAFSGSGERVYFRNGINLATPNSSNNGFHNYLQLNDGQINATVPIAIGGTAAANALDDYEEGSWTPAIGGVSSNPTISYSQQTGKYIKIGRMVKLFGRIRPSSVSGGSGGVQITGLPFTAHDDSDETGGSVGLALGFTAVPTTLQVDGGNQVIYILSSPNNTLVTDFDFSYLYFQIDYLT